MPRKVLFDEQSASVTVFSSRPKRLHLLVAWVVERKRGTLGTSLTTVTRRTSFEFF